MTILRRDTLGMKLQTVQRARGVAETHDFTVIGPPIHEQFARQCFTLHREAMVTRGGEGAL